MSETNTRDDQKPAGPAFEEGVMGVNTSDVQWPAGTSPRKPRKVWPEATREQSATAPSFDDSPVQTLSGGAHDDMAQLMANDK